MTGRPRHRGQASLELLAAVPLLLVALLVGWQLVALVRASMLAQEDARARVLRMPGSGLVSAHAERHVHGVLPGLGTLRVRATARTLAR